MGMIKGVFYIDGKMISVNISEETAKKMHLEACRRNCLITEVYKSAYQWIKDGGIKTLTEALLLQYIGNPGPCKRDKIQHSGWGDMTSTTDGE